MNSRHLIAAAALAALGTTTAFAGSHTSRSADYTPRTGMVTDVISARAVHDGLSVGQSETYGAVAPSTGHLYTRAEVTAQLRDARQMDEDVTEQQARGEAWGEVDSTQIASTPPMRVGRIASLNNEVAIAAGPVEPGYEQGYATNYAAGEAYAGADNDMTVSTMTWDAQPVGRHDRALTRAEVQSELAAARASGEFDARGELYGDIGDTKFGNLPQHNIAFVEQAGQQQPVPVAAIDAVVIPEVSEPSDSVVLWVPAGGEAVTLQPGESLLLVPVEQTPDAE